MFDPSEFERKPSFLERFSGFITDPEMWRREGEFWGGVGDVFGQVGQAINPFTPLPWDTQRKSQPPDQNGMGFFEMFDPYSAMRSRAQRFYGQGGQPVDPVPFYASNPQALSFLDDNLDEPGELTRMQWQGQQDISAAHTEWKNRAFQQIVYYARNLPPYIQDDLDEKYKLTVYNPITGRDEPNPDARPEDVQAALQEIMPQFAEFAVGSEQGRLQMKQAVEQGVVSSDALYGKGTAWEKWQHGQADDFNQVVSQAALPGAMQDPLIQNTFRQAQAMGIDTSGAESMLASSIKGSGWTDENLGAALYPVMEQVRQRQQQAQNALSATFAQQFPEAFERYKTEIGDPDEADAARLPEEGFLNWAMGKDWFVEERQQWEQEQWARYGNIYQAYLQYLGQGGNTTFEEFKQETPEIQAELELREKARVEAMSRAPSRWEAAQQQ